MIKSTLEALSDRIEAVLAKHKLSVRVTGGFVAPRWVQFQLLPGLGTRISKIKELAEELALALNVDACRVSRQRGMVQIEIPRSDPQPVRLLSLQRRLIERRKIPFGTALLGLADDGAPLLVRLPSPQVAHLLVAGAANSGKRALTRTIITSLALNHRPRQLGFILIGHEQHAFGPLVGLPHLLRPLSSEPGAIEQTLWMLSRLALARCDNGRTRAPRVVVVIDELADLTGQGTQQALAHLAQCGREAGIHLIACTQRPNSQMVRDLAQASFPVQVVGQVTSVEEAGAVTGYARCLRGARDFVAVTCGQKTRFQAAHISTREIANVVSHWSH